MKVEIPFEKKEKQIREILKFQEKITKRAGQEISLSEAITRWIAFGYAEKFRKEIYLLND